MLVLHHDLTSAASAVAVARLLRLADAGSAVRWSGVDVLGLDLTLPVTLDVLAELDRVRPEAVAHGVVLRPPSRRPPTAPAHVVAEVAALAGPAAESAWLRAAYAAYWQDDADLGDRALLARLAGEVGLDVSAVTTALGDRGRLAAVRRRAAALRGDGVGGVPVVEAHGSLLPATLGDEQLRELAAW